MATCEELNLAPEECARLSPEDKQLLGITGGATTVKGKKKTLPIINSFDALSKLVPDWEQKSIQDIVLSGAQIAPAFYKQLQDFMLQAEQEGFGPVASIGQAPATLAIAKKFYAKGGALPVSSFVGSGGVGGTGRTAAEEEYTRAQTAHLAESDRLARETLAESKRQNLLDTARALVEAQLTRKTAAQTQGVTLAGSDPFRFIGQLRGQDVAPGVQTPYDIFKGYLAGQANQPTPNIGPNSTVADLESALGKLQTGQPTAPSFGFEGGGTAQTPGPYTARLIGEQGSYIAPGTEVLITGGGQATVLPLGPGQQTGGESLLKPGSLGVFPKLFEDVRTGLGNTRAGLGFLPEGSTTTGRLGGPYGGLTTPLSQNLRRGYGELVGLGKISQADADFVTNAIGELPNPRNASQWLRSLTPVEREAVLSLYKLAGVPAAEFDAMVQSAVLSGPSRQAISLAA